MSKPSVILKKTKDGKWIGNADANSLAGYGSSSVVGCETRDSAIEMLKESLFEDLYQYQDCIKEIKKLLILLKQKQTKEKK